MNRLKEKYQSEVVPALIKSLSLDNLMQVPKVEKIVLNIGLGEALDNPKSLEAASTDLQTITGQKPVITKARVSVANFKLREGACATSVEFRATLLMAGAITPWVCASS